MTFLGRRNLASLFVILVAVGFAVGIQSAQAVAIVEPPGNTDALNLSKPFILYQGFVPSTGSRWHLPNLRPNFIALGRTQIDVGGGATVGFSMNIEGVSTPTVTMFIRAVAMPGEILPFRFDEQRTLACSDLTGTADVELKLAYSPGDCVVHSSFTPYVPIASKPFDGVRRGFMTFDVVAESPQSAFASVSVPVTFTYVAGQGSSTIPLTSTVIVTRTGASDSSWPKGDTLATLDGASDTDNPARYTLVQDGMHTVQAVDPGGVQNQAVNVGVCFSGESCAPSTWTAVQCSTKVLRTCSYELPTRAAHASTYHVVFWYGPQPVPPPGFAIGAPVNSIASVNTRGTPSVLGTVLGTVPLGTAGVIVEGSIFADNYRWWKVRWATGISGWTAQDFLRMSGSLTPPPPLPPASPPILPPPTSISVITSGSRVRTTVNLNARSLPQTGSTVLGTMSAGSLGTVETGVVTSADGFRWWKVQWDNGIVGWVVQNYLALAGSVSPLPPTPTPPSPTPVPTGAALQIGVRVTTKVSVGVRSAPAVSASIVKAQPTGVGGTITGGPVLSGSYQWWEVSWDNGPTGWVPSIYIVR